MFVSAAAFTFKQMALNVISAFDDDFCISRKFLHWSNLNETQLSSARFHFYSLKMVTFTGFFMLMAIVMRVAFLLVVFWR